VSAEKVAVKRHANRGVHPETRKRADFAAAADAACGNDRKRCDAAEAAKPVQIGTAQCPLVIYVRAEKTPAVSAQLTHDLLGAQGETFAPAMDDKHAAFTIKGHYDLLLSRAGREDRPRRVRGGGREQAAPLCHPEDRCRG